MEGPTSSGGLRNRLTRLNLHEHDDDDDDDDDDKISLYFTDNIIRPHQKDRTISDVEIIFVICSDRRPFGTRVLSGHGEIPYVAAAATLL
jgi:hypothetical protein